MKKALFFTVRVNRGLALTAAFFTFAAFAFGVYLSDFGAIQTASTAAKAQRLVIIDPGHGGEDPGAVAENGVEEKQINLAISRFLAAELEKSGVDYVMTRSDDRLIYDDGSKTIRQKKSSDLHNRLSFMQLYPHGIFVSIHQNFFSQSRYSGAQVFYSPNSSAAQQLASAIQKSIVGSLQGGNTRQIKQSGREIFLLYSASVPTVMVECGFLSNEVERDKLCSEQYQKSMAEAICGGILQYFKIKAEDD